MFRSSRNHPRGPYQSRSNRKKRHNFTGLFVAVISIISFSLLICKSPDDLDEQPFSSISSRRGSIIPFDLSVCHLQLIELAGGALSHQVHGVVEEDFLPIVTSDSIHLRFRLKPSLDASPAAVRDISAYRIIAKPAHNDSISLWDSGKVRVKSMPHSIPWNGDTLKVGSIVKWNVMVWDDLGVGPYSSQFTKFAVGPSSDEWTGQWIAHPEDVTRFENVSSTMWESDISPEKCKAWKARRPLPLARARLQLSEEEASNVVSALLVASGLGSFATTLDGRLLSSSSILDPPMTDFSQRVSYRGYDITKHLQITKNSPHVVGIALGSGWWDARPLTGGIIKPNLLPQGPLTTIAELHITLKDGSSVVKIPSGMNDWEIAKGFIRDSDLFTGDTIDLGAFQAMRNWDSPHESSRNMLGTNIVWMEPVLYHTDTTLREWRKALSERAGAMERRVDKAFSISPIGKLVPLGTPPVMPIERLAPESIKNLGDGRWLFDFGKAMSGVLRFDAGLPNPIVPETYPRSHKLETKGEEEFITVVYGDSIQMETGDINLIIVAGMGLHDGGPREQSKGEGEDTQKTAGPCFPCDHGMVLTQRDAFVVPKTSSGRFAHARQPLFTSHGFRFAEVCCTKDPPQAVHAIAYRSAFAEWGEFHSSNVLLNGAYELSRNALNSNMLGTQTDCPHRERMQYGGDLVANSPASLHFFDLSAFYTKVVNDWIDSQWDNGAYTETSVYQDLNDGEGIGQGAGETIWASLPPVLTVRHVQHYADMQLVESTFDNHVKWMNFLVANWDAGIGELIEKKYSESQYRGNDGGLGDWLALAPRDTWLTHHAYLMASARAVAYLANRMEDKDDEVAVARGLAEKVQKKINSLYMKNDGFRLRDGVDWTPGPDLGLFARIVPGPRRCAVLKGMIRLSGSDEAVIWPGEEERLFYQHLTLSDFKKMLETGKVRLDGTNGDNDELDIIWKRRNSMHEGILAVRYKLKAFSDMGFHSIALAKATGEGFPGFEYMLSHNATTLWESWWRSENVFSRNHPMLGAVAEWLVSSVAGVSLAPTAIGGKQLLFWPRIPTSAVIVQHASAMQGTKRGDASIAWEFLGLPEDKSTYDSVVVKVHIRVLVPPGSTATLRLSTRGSGISIKYARKMPNLERARSIATNKCTKRRSAGMGFHYNWEYNRVKQEWSKSLRGKAIGTPCRSYLFSSTISQTLWSRYEPVPEDSDGRSGSDQDIDIALRPGLFDMIIDDWKLKTAKEDLNGYQEYEGDLGPYCSDQSTYVWDVNDATHLI